MGDATATFDYLAVFFSIILGLAVTEILQGLRRLLIGRDRAVLSLPALLWAGILLATLAQTWWALFGLRALPEWSFGMYAIVLLQAVLLYMAAGLALPEMEETAGLDMPSAYAAHARPFFLLMLGVVVASLLKDMVIRGHLPDAANVGFHALFGTAVAVAAATRNRLFHRVAALFVALLFAAYVIVLFDRIG